MVRWRSFRCIVPGRWTASTGRSPNPRNTRARRIAGGWGAFGVSVGLLLNATAAIAGADATSTGSVVVDSNQVWSILPASTGDICTVAQSGGVLATFTGNQPAGTQAICSIRFFFPPTLIVKGTGYANVAKSLLVPTVIDGREVVFNPNPTAACRTEADAQATVAMVPGILQITQHTASAEVRRIGCGGGGRSRATARASDPLFFNVAGSTLDLAVTLQDALVEVIADPGETGAARLGVVGALGRGAIAGQDVLASWTFEQVVQANEPSFAATNLVIASETLTVTPGETLWLELSVEPHAFADGPAGVPALSLGGLVACGAALLLASIAWLARRPTAKRSA